MKRSFLQVIRQRLKSQGITQAKAARSLGVSLPTLKRWLRGDGLDLDALERLLGLSGLTWGELVSLTEGSGGRTFQYTVEQEHALADHPQWLALFDALLHRLPPRDALREALLSEPQATRALRALEKLGLIERLPGSKIRLSVQGEPVWRKNGPLSRAFRALAMTQFLRSLSGQSPGPSLSIYRLLPEEDARIQTLLADLRTTLRQAEVRGEASANRTVLRGLFVGYGSWSWSLLKVG